MKINRKKFFDGFRDRLDSTIEQEQVDGLEFLLTSFENEPLWKDVRHIAYALATVFHETAFSFQPVEEGYYLGSKTRVQKFQKTLRYYPYFGRGYVQLTWETKRIPNYSKASKRLGVDFVKNPELVMEPVNAFKIMTFGMFEGWFTSKKLSDFIKGSKCDYVNARTIINGHDKAGVIAGYARSFEKILRASLSGEDNNTQTATSSTPADGQSLPKSTDELADTSSPDTTRIEQTVVEEVGDTLVSTTTVDAGTVKVASPEPYQGMGFIAVIKRDIAAIGGGNLTFQGLSEYAQQASGWPEWLVAILTKLALVALGLSVLWIVYRLVHYTVDSWKKAKKVEIEAAANSDKNRFNIEWS